MLGVSTAYASEDYSTRALKVFCNDAKQVLDKVGGTGNIDTIWIDQDENVWFTFKDDRSKIVTTIIPKDNRKQMCIVSYGSEITDKRKYL